MSDKWREIDRKKDKSSHRKSKPVFNRNQGRKSRVSKSELDKVFSSGKLGDFIKAKEEEKQIKSNSEQSLVAKVKKALRLQDTNKFLKQAEKIIKKEGPPGNFEFLERSLDLSENNLIIQILEKMKTLLQDNIRPDRTRSLNARLKMLPVKYRDPQLKDLCQAILELL
ncbi:MAG: hypothetical protein PF689_08920 [Deltaproteobacteria bacterium]|jgi:hypothetical protein|nr:hypothetical protein [Deltaproteobacteria bacterium]